MQDTHTQAHARMHARTHALETYRIKPAPKDEQAIFAHIVKALDPFPSLLRVIRRASDL